MRAFHRRRGRRGVVARTGRRRLVSRFSRPPAARETRFRRRRRSGLPLGPPRLELRAAPRPRRRAAPVRSTGAAQTVVQFSGSIVTSNTSSSRIIRLPSWRPRPRPEAPRPQPLRQGRLRLRPAPVQCRPHAPPPFRRQPRAVARLQQVARGGGEDSVTDLDGVEDGHVSLAGPNDIGGDSCSDSTYWSRRLIQIRPLISAKAAHFPSLERAPANAVISSA